MHRALPLAAACVTATVIIALPATAKQGPDRSDWFQPYEIEYLDTYEKAHAAGHDVGANLVDDYNRPQAVVEESTERMKLWLNPPPEPEYTEETYTEEASTTYAPPATSAGGCPSSMAPESGTAGYSAYNPSSGATGCYQIIPSTAAAYGCDLSTPGGQDACAARICGDVGASAWAASGASPC